MDWNTIIITILGALTGGSLIWVFTIRSTVKKSKEEGKQSVIDTNDKWQETYNKLQMRFSEVSEKMQSMMLSNVDHDNKHIQLESDIKSIFSEISKLKTTIISVVNDKKDCGKDCSISEVKQTVANYDKKVSKLMEAIAAQQNQLNSSFKSRLAQDKKIDTFMNNIKTDIHRMPILTLLQAYDYDKNEELIKSLYLKYEGNSYIDELVKEKIPQLYDLKLKINQKLDTKAATKSTQISKSKPKSNSK